MQRKYRGEEELDSSQFMRVVKEKMKGLGMDSKFRQRPVNEGSLVVRRSVMRFFK